MSATNKYPFERFTEDSKLTLVRAQEEAEQMGVGYIGTEHILLGLLRVESGSAFRVLRRFGVSHDRVRKAVSAVSKRRPGGLVIPTSRVKRIIEISFLEASRLGHESVDTGHLLMGVVMEGEGIAPSCSQTWGPPPRELSPRWSASSERRPAAGARTTLTGRRY